jgi:hypothetical protein
MRRSPDVLEPMPPAIGDLRGAHVSDERLVAPSVYRELCISTLGNIPPVSEKVHPPDGRG